MPAFSTHYIFAYELLPFIKETADFNICDDAVLIGTQGPDIFFFHRIFPWMLGRSLRRSGSRLHRSKPAEIFEAMREYCKKSENPDIAKSYIYGFILHYALDRKCHPYVYSMQEQIIKSNPLLNPHSVHNTIEFAADTYLLNKRMKFDKPYLFNTAATISDDSEIASEIGRLWEYVLPAVTDIKIRAKQAETAVNDTKTMQKILLDKHLVKQALIRPIEIIIAPVSKNFRFTSLFRPKDLEKAKKYVNIDNVKWSSPYSNREFYDSFEELFEKAKEEAEIMLLDFQSGKNCKEITRNLSFLTGVEVE